jgi:predicted nicotinamide N-methyase
MFNFDFTLPSNNHQDNEVDSSNNNISKRTLPLKIKGYKTDAEQVWQSTGLTLWRASHYLCEYQIEHYSELFTSNKRVLELGAGLGLNGILAWRLMLLNASAESSNVGTGNGGEVCITDGDIDALVHLRENVERNRPSSTDDDDNGDNNTKATSNKVSCHQLIWGQESSQKFLSHIAHNQKYDVLIASDIVYSAVIVEPLWETVSTLLEREGGVFVMAFARRKVPVSIDLVLEKAVESGFGYDLVKEDLEDGIWVYEFRFS